LASPSKRSQKPARRWSTAIARGNEWVGKGDIPDWLKAAENTGVNREFFGVQPAPLHGSKDRDFPRFLRNH